MVTSWELLQAASVAGPGEVSMSTNYPTPVYSHVGRGDVYEPSENSVLLIDALEKDAERLKIIGPYVCLEVGSGSRVVSAFLASVLGPSALYLCQKHLSSCTDVNPAAAQCTAKILSAARHHIPGGDSSATSKWESGRPPLQPPPYVVGGSGMEAAWAGGKRGQEVTDRFLPVVAQLLSSKRLLYLITIAENDPEEIIHLLGKCGLSGEPCSSTRARNERLSVLRFHRS